MGHNYKSRIINEFVTNLKSTIFDVMTSMRRNMDIIEAQIGTAKDEKKELELQQLWAEYHEADKQCLVSAKRMEAAMEKLDSCFEAYYTCLYQPGKAKNNTNNVNISSEEAINESVAETDASAETETKEETSEVTTGIDAITTAEVKETASEGNETEEKDNSLIESVPEEIVNDANTVSPETSADNNETRIELPSSSPEGLLPLIPEETPSPSEKESTVKPVSDISETNTVIPLPTAEDGIKTAETTTNETESKEHLTFTKEGNEETKAIIVNLKQLTKLSESLGTQQALLEEKIQNSQNEMSTQEQVEQLMNQLPSLYEQGEVAKAEEISEQIRALNEQKTPTA